ncbi:MAG: hypothetical protein ABSE83_12160 [Methanobacterium sp.]
MNNLMNERVMFIGIIIILVGVLGLAGSYILFSNHDSQVTPNNTTVNNNNINK